MAIVSDVRLAQAAQKAEFPPAEIPMAVAIALAESSGDPAATHQNSDVHHSIDYGAWEINGYWWANLFPKYKWSDVDDNAKMAKVVFASAGNKWTDWATYNHGSHLQYLDRGRAAAAALNGSDHGGDHPVFTLTRYLKFIITARNKSQLIHGSDVTALQKTIGVTADGYFGPDTARALRRFQINHHLTPDGIAGPNVAKTLGWLFNA